jgi:hypothetical protein
MEVYFYTSHFLFFLSEPFWFPNWSSWHHGPKLGQYRAVNFWCKFTTLNFMKLECNTVHVELLFHLFDIILSIYSGILTNVLSPTSAHSISVFPFIHWNDCCTYQSKSDQQWSTLAQHQMTPSEGLCPIHCLFWDANQLFSNRLGEGNF